MSAIDEVKQRTDIVEVVGQYAQLTKAGRNFRALCPFHNEKTPSFFVFPDRQSWHCFGACGTGGDAFAFIMKRENVDFPEALRLLADRAGVTLPSYREVEAKKDVKDRLYQANEAAALYFHDLLVGSPQGDSVRAYLQERGLSDKTIGDFCLGYAQDSWDGIKRHLNARGFTEGELLDAGLLSSNDSGRTYDRWRNRLIIPIRDVKGRTSGFGARVLGQAEGPKYINSPQSPVFDKSAQLYGLDMAESAIRSQDLAVIVEGYMDVMAAHQHGFTNVVASMGTSITERQIAALKRLTRNLALALDSDAAGEEAMLRCVGYENTLEAEMRVIVLPEGKDPDDVIKADSAAWEQLVAGGKPVIDFMFDRVAGRLDLTKVRDRVQARDLLYPVVEGITDVVRRSHYLSKLSWMVGVDERSMVTSGKKGKAASGRGRGVATERDAQKPGEESLFTSPLEEYCMSLLLQHPALKQQGLELPVEYFENSENREIFCAWRENCDCSEGVLKEKVDIDVREHLDRLLGKSIPPAHIEQKYVETALRLREKYLRNLAKKRETFFSHGGSGGDVAAARPEEQDIEIKNELRKVFGQKGRGSPALRR